MNYYTDRLKKVRKIVPRHVEEAIDNNVAAVLNFREDPCRDNEYKMKEAILVALEAVALELSRRDRGFGPITTPAAAPEDVVEKTPKPVPVVLHGRLVKRWEKLFGRRVDKARTAAV